LLAVGSGEIRADGPVHVVLEIHSATRARCGSGSFAETGSDAERLGRGRTVSVAGASLASGGRKRSIR
jgi:hypothetical protein